ncbi:hypothetical protein Tco_1172514 [Tanacetum coccineum]
MEDDMLKTQSKVVDILCNLELIYPPAFFDIMIHLVIHLPLEAIFGGPIRPRWMYPFERYMKKLKNYVRNKAKPEGSIAEGYVAEEALTFSSHYFRDVTTKFNRPDRNVDCPPPTCQFQVFKSLCKSIGLRSVIRIDHQELKKVIWYVLHNSPEIDTYRAKFKIEFPNKDMKEEFPGWFGKQIRQRHVDNDPGVNESSELFALACGPSQTPISVNSCVVNGVRFVVHSRDERRTTQNSGICSPGPDGEMYYGQLEQILEFSYLSFKTVLFRVKWFDTSNEGRKVKRFVIRNNMTQIWANGKSFKDDQYIPATQVKQVFYLEDMARRPPNWKVVEDDFATLHIDGQSMDVVAPPDIIDVNKDDDIIDDEDALPYDLTYSYDEDLVNVDDDDDVAMSADVARGHGGDDRPPPHQIGGGCRGHPKTQPWRQESRQAEYPQGNQEPRVKEDHGSIWPAGDPFPMYFRSWHNIPEERKAGVLGKIGDAQIAFWADPKNVARCAQNARNRAKSTVICWQGSRSLVVLRDRHMESSATGEYSSLIQTYFDTHTVDGVFLRDDERLLYEEMLRLQGLGTYTDDQIMAILPSQYDVSSGSGSGGGGDDELGDDEDASEEEDEDS